MSRALEWIQAQQSGEQGAKRVEKLAGRDARQGLVGVAILSNGLPAPRKGGATAGEDESGVGRGLVRAAMVEVRCETDFVARTDEFRHLVESVARSVAFFAEPLSQAMNIEPPSSSWLESVSVANVADTPVVPPSIAETATHAEDTPPATVQSTIRAAVARLGENISLTRVVRLAIDPSSSVSIVQDKGEQQQVEQHIAATYLHGAKAGVANDGSFQSGSLASLLVCRFRPARPETTSTTTVSAVKSDELARVTRGLARQVVAMPTNAITNSAGSSASTSTNEGGSDEPPSTALYDQPLMTLPSNTDAFVAYEPGSSVGHVLDLWRAQRGGASLEVVDLARWTVGEDL